jgi:hypothetical protein
LADAPERKGVEILAPRAGTMRPAGDHDRAPGDAGDRIGAAAKAGAERQPRRGMFEGLKLSAEPAKATESAQGAKEKAAPKRGMFDGLKLSSRTPTPAKEAPARADQGHTHDFRRAVERASRSAETVLQARASGGPVLEHQKVALERATEALDQIRPGASRDMASAMERDPGLLREAAAGRSGPMVAAIGEEARVRADPNLRADRFVERWQGLKQERDRLYRAGDMAGREKAGKDMVGMAKSLERDPQVESILRGRTRELGLEIGMNRSRDVSGGELGRQLTQELGISRDRGMSR